MESIIFNVFLYLHIAAGTIGLVIGPLSMYAPKRKGLHTSIGIVYFYMMAVVCASAVPLSILHWEKSWWFLIVAGFSFRFAWVGCRAVKRRGNNWLKLHISGMLGSYIAMTTALLLQNAASLPGYGQLPKIFYWLLPTIIGAPFIIRMTKKYVKQQSTT